MVSGQPIEGIRHMAKIIRALLIAGILACPVAVSAATDEGRAGVDAFNRALTDATRRIDNAALVSLWEDDGVSLLPSTNPIIGKKAIAAFLDKAVAQMPGARMDKYEMKCQGIEVSGNWASEWCQEHQRVLLAGGKPPFEGWGKLLYVLHRGADGRWRTWREMWNNALAPDTDRRTP
jgi:ketosteroid isomerase-like protein